MDLSPSRSASFAAALGSFALFGTESAVGRRFRMSLNNGASFTPWRTIIGVVSDVRMIGPFPNATLPDPKSQSSSLQLKLSCS